MLGILGQLVALGVLVCFILVLIQQFKEAGALHGIIGIITCGIWTFIWGWMNLRKLDHQKLMPIWTVLWVVWIILNVVVGGFRFWIGSIQTT